LKQTLARVISSSEVMPGTHLLWLESPLIAATAGPGQFVMVRGGSDTLLRRPLSVHQVAGERLALLFATVGKGTNWLSQRKEGDSIDLFGPLGNGFSINHSTKNLLLVAGGIGIAPLRFLADEAAKQEKDITLLLGAPTSGHLYPESLLPPGIRLARTTEDGRAGEKGMITNLIPKYIDWADQIFACGPLAMYKTMSRMPELKNKPVQVSLEVRMGCGLGICYACTIKTGQGLRQVCKDGPVFELNDVYWDEVSC
jgi:dihydroorotate dehydrogenase electron transfer subunit